MPSYSDKSKSELETCHPDLQKIFGQAIRGFDHAVIEGHRGKEKQNRFFREGKSQVEYPNSRHNKSPSMAVDAAPYPIDWEDRRRMTLFAGYVLGIAKSLKREGIISHDLRWGGDWDCDTEVSDNDFDDLVHFELV